MFSPVAAALPDGSVSVIGAPAGTPGSALELIDQYYRMPEVSIFFKPPACRTCQNLPDLCTPKFDGLVLLGS